MLGALLGLARAAGRLNALVTKRDPARATVPEVIARASMPFKPCAHGPFGAMGCGQSCRTLRLVGSLEAWRG